jgi:hypothetical protein
MCNPNYCFVDVEVFSRRSFVSVSPKNVLSILYLLLFFQEI